MLVQQDTAKRAGLALLSAVEGVAEHTRFTEKFKEILESQLAGLATMTPEVSPPVRICYCRQGGLSKIVPVQRTTTLNRTHTEAACTHLFGGI